MSVGPFLFQIEPDSAENTRIHVCDPNEREARDEVASPVGIEKLIPGNDQEGSRDVMAEAVFTGEQVKKLALIDAAADFTLRYAIVSEFTHDLLVRDRPRNGSDGKGENE